MNYYVNYFASVYGEGNYNQSQYSTGTVTSTSASGGKSGTLADTGFDLMLGATIGCIIIFTALVIRVWKRPSKKQPSSNVE